MSIQKANSLIQNTGVKSLFIVRVVQTNVQGIPKIHETSHSTADITYSNECSGVKKIYSSTYRRLNVIPNALMYATVNT